MTKRQASALVVGLSLIVVATGCKKKVPAPPPPPPPVKAEAPPPPLPRPRITFSAEPTTVERGQCATLRWTTENATQVAINPGLGNVAAAGNQRVCPTSTTTYSLSASGPGGSENATATVNVTAPPPPPPPPPAVKVTKSFSERLSELLQDALFDYDKSEVREDARNVLTRNAESLKQLFGEMPSEFVNVEGHCDERGSAEYNLGLGDRRATAAKEFLVQLGVSGDKLKTVSYGKERPTCSDENEGCYQRNRRAHFSAGQ